ncbi:MAG: DUF4124 domain-containing protein [Betaproteobacteria bacterium]
MLLLMRQMELSKYVIFFVLFFAGLLHSDVYAEVYKCRGPNGQVIISDTGCFAGTVVESARASEFISPERQRQAREVNARRLNQLNAIENENAAYRQSQQVNVPPPRAAEVAPQNAIAFDSDAYQTCVRDVERQAASQAVKAEMIAACRTAGMTQRSSGMSAGVVSSCVKNVERTGASGSEKARQLAICHGGDVAPLPPPPQKVVDTGPPLPAHIKNCFQNTCTDTNGMHYKTQFGKTVRSDGKRCHQRGSAIYCD